MWLSAAGRVKGVQEGEVMSRLGMYQTVSSEIPNKYHGIDLVGHSVFKVIFSEKL
jgi:hypothetical protein